MHSLPFIRRPQEFMATTIALLLISQCLLCTQVYVTLGCNNAMSPKCILRIPIGVEGSLLSRMAAALLINYRKRGIESIHYYLKEFSFCREKIFKWEICLKLCIFATRAEHCHRDDAIITSPSFLAHRSPAFSIENYYLQRTKFSKRKCTEYRVSGECTCQWEEMEKRKSLNEYYK